MSNHYDYVIGGGDDREERHAAELYASDQQVRDARPIAEITAAGSSSVSAMSSTALTSLVNAIVLAVRGNTPPPFEISFGS